MGNIRMVLRYLNEAVNKVSKLTHESYKAIKHMNKIELVAFMTRVSHEGFRAGYEAAKKELASTEQEAKNADD